MQFPLRPGDPWHDKLQMDHMKVYRNQLDPTYGEKDVAAGLEQGFTNTETHWWDGSEIYGSSLEIQRKLRSFEGGKLRTPNDQLPVDEATGVQEAGFVQNWWLGLGLYQTLFALEHNHICDVLAANYPDMEDEELFVTARHVLAAELAKIHTVEWTTAILDSDLLWRGMNSNYHGLADGKRRVDGKAWWMQSMPLSGIMGHWENQLYGREFAMPEAFVTAYRMHSLLPEGVDVHKVGAQPGDEPSGYIDFGASREAGSAKAMEATDLPTLINSFGLGKPGALQLHNFPEFLQSFSPVDDRALADLCATDLIRDRQKGMRYNSLRRGLGLKPITKFEDLYLDPKNPKNAADIATMREIYNDDIELLDAMVGMHAEEKRHPGFGFSETAFRVFLLIATRRLEADKFFTSEYNEETYTDVGLQMVDDCTMGGMFTRHFPQLAKANMPKNVFFNWSAQEQAKRVER
jgi:hypothetical protein